MRALILAAGLGTRLKPFTESHPKALFPIGGKVLLEWQIDMLRRAGIRDITVNIHHFADQIIDFTHAHDAQCTEDEKWNLRFSDETALLLETGGAIRKVYADRSEMQDEPLLVLNADILSNIDLEAFVASYEGEFAKLVVSERKTQRYFVFEDAKMLGWTNIATGGIKPETLTAEKVALGKLLAFSGMHILSPEAMKMLQDYPERFSITDFYIDMCASHAICAYVPMEYRMMDIGKTECLAEAEAFVERLAIDDKR